MLDSWLRAPELPISKELEFFSLKESLKCGSKTHGVTASIPLLEWILIAAQTAIKKHLELISNYQAEEIQLLLKYFRKIDFVCHQCAAFDRTTLTNVESIYDPCTNDPHDPPYIACENCITGILLPMKYTNKHNVIFSSNLETKKNEKQTWRLDFKPAPDKDLI